MLIIVVSSFLTAFVFTFIGEILQMLLGVRGQWVVPSGGEFFVGLERFLFARGAFVPIVPWGWLAWLCSVTAYALLLWGGTWWFVRRTDRKLLGKKQTGVQ